MIQSIFIDNNSDKTILITGKIHGNEPIGELVCKEWAYYRIIKSKGQYDDKNVLNRYNYHIFPRINPTDTREDWANIDINRNFDPTYKELSVTQRVLLEKMKDKYFLHFDIHEILPGEWVKGNGFYIYYSQDKGANICRRTITALQNEYLPINLTSCTGTEGIIDSTHDEESIGTLEHYTHTNKGTQASYTLETYTGDSLDDRLKSHLLAMEILILQHHVPVQENCTNRP